MAQNIKATMVLRGMTFIKKTMAKQQEKQTKEVLKGYLLSQKEGDAIMNFIQSLNFKINQVKQYQTALNLQQILTQLPPIKETVEIEPKDEKK